MLIWYSQRQLSSRWAVVSADTRRGRYLARKSCVTFSLN
jgi:hypothetical protein